MKLYAMNFVRGIVYGLTAIAFFLLALNLGNAKVASANEAPSSSIPEEHAEQIDHSRFSVWAETLCEAGGPTINFVTEGEPVETLYVDVIADDVVITHYVGEMPGQLTLVYYPEVSETIEAGEATVAISHGRDYYSYPVSWDRTECGDDSFVQMPIEPSTTLPSVPAPEIGEAVVQERVLPEPDPLIPPAFIDAELAYTGTKLNFAIAGAVLLFAGCLIVKIGDRSKRKARLRTRARNIQAASSVIR